MLFGRTTSTHKHQEAGLVRIALSQSSLDKHKQRPAERLLRCGHSTNLQSALVTYGLWSWSRKILRLVELREVKSVTFVRVTTIPRDGVDLVGAARALTPASRELSAR